MPVEVNELSVRARVRDEEKENNCSTPNCSDQNQQRGAQGGDSSTRQASETVAEFVKRQKER